MMPGPCGLCGEDPAAGFVSVWEHNREVFLCHDQAMSCYHRWTVYGDRPSFAPGDIVRLHHGEMETTGLVVAVTDNGVHVEVDGPRARLIVMPVSMVSPRVTRLASEDTTCHTGPMTNTPNIDYAPRCRTCDHALDPDGSCPVNGQQGDEAPEHVAIDLIYLKRSGVDCTENESAWIKGFFDAYHPEDTERGRELAEAYPLEQAEWFEELERGDRPNDTGRAILAHRAQIDSSGSADR